MSDYEEAKKLGLVDKDRWGDGIAHHPESIRLMEFLRPTDSRDYADYFCWKEGGDGDNGETLMYQMDPFFEVKDYRANEVNDYKERCLIFDAIIEQGIMVKPYASDYITGKRRVTHWIAGPTETGFDSDYVDTTLEGAVKKLISSKNNELE